MNSIVVLVTTDGWCGANGRAGNSIVRYEQRLQGEAGLPNVKAHKSHATAIAHSSVRFRRNCV